MTQALAGLLVGRTLAHRYRIEELIGRGGMSVVYRARDERLRRGVAVKVISLPAASEEEHRNLRDRLRREAAAAARVPPHPNVMQVYDFGTDTELDLDFIVMELLEGRDLKVILSDAPPGYNESRQIIREAARGLAAGHRAGIVHRDVKPANILVISAGSDTTGIPAGTVKLLDFGIARILSELEDDELTRAGFSPQSPAYASPEQRANAPAITSASDVYQLGLVAYELLSGVRAVEGRTGSGARWLAVPELVREVVERALRADPADRYPDGTAFAEAFARAVEAGGQPASHAGYEPTGGRAASEAPAGKAAGGGAAGETPGSAVADDPTVFLEGVARGGAASGQAEASAAGRSAPSQEMRSHPPEGGAGPLGVRSEPQARQAAQPSNQAEQPPKRHPAATDEHRAPHKRRGVQLAALAIALLLIVLAVRGFNQIGPEPARSPALASDLNALEAEFRDLSEEAVEVLSERAIELNLP